MIRPRHSPSLRLHRAETFVDRLLGLTARPPLAQDEAMVFPRCSAVHTCFMRGAIDLAFLDGEYRVCAVRSSLRPWRTAFCRRARLVIELAPGTIDRLGITAGDRLMARGDRGCFIRAKGGKS